jgi:hypothetical protein
MFQIWEAVDSKQGFLTRNGLYKALALTALAQQGKNINDKLLETFSGQGICFKHIYLSLIAKQVLATYIDHLRI